MQISFAKMHGLGNDFVIIDAVSYKLTLSPAMIARLADRRYGVGCDQVLLLEPSTTPATDYNFRVFNADGGEAGQCGNGVRCLAKFIKYKGLSQKSELALGIRDKIIKAQFDSDHSITALMPEPIFVPTAIPLVAAEKSLRYNIKISGYPEEVMFGAVSMGNPHAVIAVTDIAQAPVGTLGALLSKEAIFPEGVNVGFMQVVNRGAIKLRVYERGSQETLACGSGACAAVAVGRVWDMLDATVRVVLCGGELVIKWEGPGSNIFMSGPATMVFMGEIYL